MFKFRSLSLKFIFLGSIMLAFLAIYIYAGFLFTHHIKGEGRKINLAGRQRMLTFNIALHMHAITYNSISPDIAIHAKDVEKKLAQYEEVLYGLRDGSERINLEPLNKHDKESISKLNTLIGLWENTQKPVLLDIIKNPAGEEKCKKCHSAIRDNIGKIDDLVYSIERHYDKEIKDFDKFRFYAFGFFFVLSIFLIFFVRKSIIKPVRRLKDATSEVEKGNFDVKVDVKSLDEIGRFSETFNQMAGALKKAFEEIKNHAQGLEDKIRERTRELEDANIELQALNREVQLRRVEAEEARLQAEAASRTKSEFLANMSHELRTPLNAIIGFSDMMIHGMAGEFTEQQLDYLKDIKESGEFLLSLINDILDLARVEAGKMELELSEFDVKDLIERSMILFKEKAMKHRIRLIDEVAPDVGTIVADERRIKQVIVNLLSNAMKFTPDGGSVTVRARLTRDEGRVVHPSIEISVEDTGIGIKAEDIPRLFKPFQQLESLMTKRYEGTGLGLALCKRIVELHRGRIWVESEVGKGSRFTFTIPVRQ